MHQDALEREDVIWALAAMCQLHRIPFDGNLVLRAFPPPYTLETLLHAAAAVGFRVGARDASATDLAEAPLPVLALLEPVAAATSVEGSPRVDGASAVPEPLPARLALVVRADGGSVVFIDPSSPNPQSLGIEDFEARFAGRLVNFFRSEQPLADTDAKAESARPFGFSWFVPELLKHRKIWRDVLAASLAIQLLALATPLFTQVVIDKVVVHQTVNTLVVIGAALALVMLFNAGMTWVRQYLVLHTGNRVDAVLGTRVFEHLFSLPPRYFEHRPTGTVVARMHGVETIREFVSGAAVSLVLDLPFLAVFLAIMLWYSWALTLVTLATLAAIVAISLAIVPAIRARLNHQFLLGARNQAFLTEYVSGVETVKSLQMEPQLKARYGDYLAGYLTAGFNTRQLSNSYNVVANTLEQLMALLILVIGAWMVMGHDGFTIGMLVAFQMFAARLAQPMLRLVGLWQEFQQAAIAVKRLGDVMNAPAEPYSVLPARSSTDLVEIELSELSFRYAENLPYLYQRLNLRIRPGATFALMGPSGSGKSTLAKLLQGFYLPTDGQIRLNGRDARNLAANELRAYFGVVPQETVLFSGTIYDNLILANPHASFQQVVQACRMAEIHDVIERLPDGYQTTIGEHGIGLSGGQRQRLAIARALLKRPRVLIFDEATSNLDGETAEQFARTVNQLRGRVTMLFIAHHLPRALQVDEIVRLGPTGAQPAPRAVRRGGE
jgi:subfamily B ATP-binding cassette protein HlyB/CyaB